MSIWTVEAEGQSSPVSTGRIQNGTAQQDALWDTLEHGESHVVLEARAGTGKTTSILEGMHRLPRDLKLTYCAFNKSIATEFQAKAPPNCRASTTHSLGFAMIKNACGDVSVNDFKVQDAAEKYFPDKWKDRESRYAVARLVGLCKQSLADGSDPDFLMDIAGAYSVDLGRDPESVLAVAPELLTESLQQTSIIDYDDMLWLPVMLGLNAPPCDILFIDEAQDLSAIQQSLMMRLCPNGRIVAVGDPRQAIYQFRGADADSIPNTIAKLGNSRRGVVTLPLTVTWRCPWSHVDLANAIVPDLEAAPNAIDGEIIDCSPDEVAALMANFQPGQLVLSRTNAPLISACYRTLRAGTKAIVRGRDIGKGLLAVVARMRAKSIPDLVSRLDDYAVVEREKLSKLRHPEGPLMALEDKVSCLMAMTDGVRSIDDLKSKVSTLFSDADNDGDAVVFSSIHRAKGLECDDVVILRPDLLPHPMSKKASEKIQEANLVYVASTRSKNRLTFAGSIPEILKKGA